MIARICSGVFAAWLCLAGTLSVAGTAPPLRFNRDIRPILADNCFACHGPDRNQRKAGLRLDSRDDAMKPADSGETAVVPGKPDESALVARIISEDPGEVMPPPNSNKKLTSTQKELLRRWIAEGALYETHWAFIPPQRAGLPEVKLASWPRNPIDYFILARLEQEGLQPSPEADAATLQRRLSLDLTGLPPQPETTGAAGAAVSGDAWLRLVDQLLESPHYGERMAVDWLDAARFADSNGYQVDRDREAWPWRDWVISAFNRNMPFDQFTMEQLAGDLLPNATMDQRIATGFNRNHMLNEEGGIIPEEFLAEYCADRVETTATVWLGQTFNCARCHDHKFDVFTQRDFYGMYAFFHNVTEKGIGNYGANIRRNAPPMVKLPAPELESKLAELNRQLTEAKRQVEEAAVRLNSDQENWATRLQQSPVAWQTLKITAARFGKSDAAVDAERRSIRFPSAEPGNQQIVAETELSPGQSTALRFELVRLPESAESRSDGAIQLGQLKVYRPGTKPDERRSVTVTAAEADGTLPAAETTKALDANGKTQAAVSLKSESPAIVLVEFEVPEMIAQNAPKGTETDGASRPDGKLVIELSLTSKSPLPPWELRILATDSPADQIAPPAVLAISRKPAGERTPQEVKQIVDFRSSKDPQHRAHTRQVGALTKQIDDTELQIPTALVMEEMPSPRTTNILIRGAYDKKGEAVTAATPAALLPFSPDLPRNRLGLARWLVDPANPLPARVTVNRLWQSVFGTGLVRTSEDFGVQGEPPSHPELLDWLATEFVRTGWDVKGMMRLIVTSATYRQSSRLTPELQRRDPENRLLARGPRFRLQAEFVRDQALAASGLLVPRIGGPSVRPYHPPGLYEQVVAGSSANTYVQGKGDDLHRRTLYTYWKRSVPNPAMLVFDAPFRETCTMRRPRTNTPLQALNLMNDPTYVEAARLLARRMLRDGGDTIESRIAHGFRVLLGRRPRPAESTILAAAHRRALNDFHADPGAASELLKIGTVSADPGVDAAQWAAMTVVASTLLNLDETVMKE